MASIYSVTVFTVEQDCVKFDCVKNCNSPWLVDAFKRALNKRYEGNEFRFRTRRNVTIFNEMVGR